MISKDLTLMLERDPMAGLAVSYRNHCEICGNNSWELAYNGLIRQGKFGQYHPKPQNVWRCKKCGVERLDENACQKEEFYEGEKYRKLLSEPTTAEGFFREHDSLQLGRMNCIWPTLLRGQRVVDIGCAAGSFLDHIKGLTADAYAIEPCLSYHDSLRSRGYNVFNSIAEAISGGVANLDIGFSFSVIEHVADPVAFLSDIKKMLKDDGLLILSTPNRNDILMHTLEDDYRSFFYRSVHRWYFDDESITFCAIQAGFKVIETRCVHRFGISNFLKWLRDRKPGGHLNLPFFDRPEISLFWRHYLESQSVGDYLYQFLKPQK